jgi:cytochrome c nitrite reductase small subunit
MIIMSANGADKPRRGWVRVARSLALPVLAGVLLGLAAETFDYAEGTSYLSNDPKACVNCHIMRDQFDGWQKGPHHATAVCNDCHVPHDLVGKYLVKVEHGYRHSKGFTFQDFHEPIRMTESSRRVVEFNCVRCHQEMVSHIAPGGGGDPGCVRCHTGVGHGPTR